MNFIMNFQKLINRIYIPMIILSVIAVISVSLYVGVISPFVFFIILVLIGCGILRISEWKDYEKFIFSIKLFTFILSSSVVVACFVYIYYMNIYGNPYQSGGTDDAVTEQQANTLRRYQVTSYEDAKNIITKLGSGTWNPSGNYVMVVALVHKFINTIGLESDPFNPVILNSFFLSITSVLVWHISSFCCKFEATARFAGYFFGLIPTVAYNAAHIFRDSLISLGLVTIIALIFIIIKRLEKITVLRILKTIPVLLILLLCWIFTANFREGYLVIIAFMIAIIFIFRIKHIVLRCIFFFVLIILVIISNTYLEGFYNRADIFLNFYTNYRASMGLENGIGTGIYRLPALLSYPLRIIYTSINPLPFPSRLITEDYLRLGTIIWIIGLPFLIISIKESLRTARNVQDLYLRSIVIAFIGTYLPVAIITLQTRHIVTFIPFGAILIASGIEKNKGPLLSFIYFVLLLSGFFLAIFYAIIKLT